MLATWPRVRRHSRSDRPAISWSPRRIEPDTAAPLGERPIRASATAVFPLPDSPAMPTTWPGRTLIVNLLTARSGPVGVGYSTLRSATDRTGSPSLVTGRSGLSVPERGPAARPRFGTMSRLTYDPAGASTL